MGDQTQHDDVGDFAGWFAGWREYGLSALDLIDSYTGLLLAGKFGPVNDEQRDALEIVRLGSRQARAGWEEPQLYLQLRATGVGPAGPAMPLAEVIEAACRRLRADFNIEPRLALAGDLPPVAGRDLATAFYFLMCPDFHDMIRLQDHPPLCAAGLDGPQSIRVSIRVDAGPFVALPARPGSRLAIAELLFQRCGGRLHLSHEPNAGTQFEIFLPAAPETR